MSMQKLRGIRNTGVYTAQRSMLEHLLRLEEIILEKSSGNLNFQEKRERIAQQLKEYKEQHHINKSFNIEDIQHYFFATAERKMPWRKSFFRGLYTSTLIEQAEGDSPITINMEGRAIACLLYTINTPRHITINNTKGDRTGAYAGSDRGQAHLTINNTEGDCTGAFAGNDHGTAYLTINNTNGDFTGALAGSNNGHAIIVAYNNKGEWQFDKNEGILIFNNPEENSRIERVTDKQRKNILQLISQNALPEDIMAYLRGST